MLSIDDVGPIAVGAFGVAPSGCVGGLCCWRYALDEIGVPPVVAAAAVDPWLEASLRSDTANGLSFSTERRRQSSGRTGEFVSDVGVGIACADDWAVCGVLGVCEVDDGCPAAAAEGTFVSSLIFPASAGTGGSACRSAAGFRDTAPVTPPFGWPPSIVVAAGLAGTMPSEDENEVRGVVRLERPTSPAPLPPPIMRPCRGDAMAESLELPAAPSEDRMSDSPADEAE